MPSDHRFEHALIIKDGYEPLGDPLLRVEVYETRSLTSTEYGRKYDYAQRVFDSPPLMKTPIAFRAAQSKSRLSVRRLI